MVARVNFGNDKVAGSQERADEGQAHHLPAAVPTAATPKASKKRSRSVAAESEAAEAGGAAVAAGPGAANFAMVDKYGPLLCAEFLTGHNLMLVERSPSFAACCLLHSRLV